jgi:aryl-alcohol dehydrogenase-like predicted oxidoreductase
VENIQRLSLGTAQFGLSYGIGNKNGRMTILVAKNIVNFARENGISSIDTAIAYGDAESRLGKIGIGDWKVVSKLPSISVKSGTILESVTVSIQKSLELLRLNTLHGLLLHKPAQLLEKGGDEVYSSLLAAKKRGLVHKIGISIYDPSELDQLLSRFKFDLVQAPFNVLDNRLRDSGWMSRLGGMGIDLEVRSIFLQGLLLMKRDARPSQFLPWKKTLDKWDCWLKDNKLTAMQACLGHVLSIPEISKVVVGVESLNQLQEIIVASKDNISIRPGDLSITDLSLINPVNWQ